MRVKHIFFVTALTAAATQLLGPGGLTIAFCIASGWAFVFFASDPHGQQNRVGRLVIAGIVVFLLLLLLLPAVEMPREATRRMQCRNNISAIVLALHYYEAKYKTLPPAITYDSQGKPMHSWRVLLLPYLEEQRLYESYSMSEPWDGPYNSQLLQKMPSAYKCPSNDSPSFETGYCVVVGERTCFPPYSARRLREIVDDSGNTAAIVETKRTVPWMAPQDLSLEQFKQDVTTWAPNNLPPHYHVGLLTSYFSNGNLGMVDGSRPYIGGSRDGELWDKLLQIDDGIPTRSEAGDFRDASHNQYTRARPEGYLAIAVFALLAFLPALWLRK